MLITYILLSDHYGGQHTFLYLAINICIRASAIHSNGTLEKLYLSDNDLQGGALTIVKSLKYVSALKELFLDNNNIPDEVFVELANIFATMNLEVLDLSFNFCNCQERLFQKVCVVSTPSLLYV